MRLSRITTATAPDLIQTHGVGPDTASTLLISAGDNPHRLRNESSWAALLGSNPTPASSGKTNRHRLNRGGDRQANAALWRIAFVRMRGDPDTRAYIDKRIKEGKSKPEAIRCLKRYIARELREVAARSPRLTVGASLLSDRAVRDDPSPGPPMSEPEPGLQTRSLALGLRRAGADRPAPRRRCLTGDFDVLRRLGLLGSSAGLVLAHRALPDRRGLRRRRSCPEPCNPSRTGHRHCPTTVRCSS